MKYVALSTIFVLGVVDAFFGGGRGWNPRNLNRELEKATKPVVDIAMKPIIEMQPPTEPAINVSGYRHVPQGCVSGHNIVKYSDKSVVECADICDARADCLAFEYGVDYGAWNTNLARDCQLQSGANFAGCDGAPYNLDVYIKEATTVPPTTVPPKPHTTDVVAAPTTEPPNQHTTDVVAAPTEPAVAPAPVQTPTATTEPPTQPPTEPPTQPPTEPPTQPPTEPPTEPPTDEVASPTEPPTDPPTDAVGTPTEPPTDPPTDAVGTPTEPPTQPPSDEAPAPVQTPTDPPSEPLERNSTVHTVDWVEPFTNEAARRMTVASGDVITFEWTHNHNVYEMPTATAFRDCNFSSAVLLGNTTGVQVTMPLEVHGLEIKYFACSVSGHCENGQKLAVTVGDPDSGSDSDSTEADGRLDSDDGSDEKINVGLILGVSSVVAVMIVVALLMTRLRSKDASPTDYTAADDTLIH